MVVSRRCSWVASVVLLAGCSHTAPAEPVRSPAATPEPAAPVEKARAPEPCCAPEGAVFLVERGIVTYEWTLELSRSGAQRGESKLTFDRWGRRQFSSGNPGPNSDKVVLIDAAGMTTYLPQLRSAMTLPWNAGEAFTPEERQLLKDAFPVDRLSSSNAKVVVGIPCIETSLERKLPEGGALFHTECVGKGIILESLDSAVGGVIGGLRSHVVATRVDFEAEVPEAVFEIPADVPVIDMGARFKSPSERQRVLDATSPEKPESVDRSEEKK